MYKKTVHTNLLVVWGVHDKCTRYRGLGCDVVFITVFEWTMVFSEQPPQKILSWCTGMCNIICNMSRINVLTHLYCGSSQVRSGQVRSNQLHYIHVYGTACTCSQQLKCCVVLRFCFSWNCPWGFLTFYWYLDTMQKSLSWSRYYCTTCCVHTWHVCTMYSVQ